RPSMRSFRAIVPALAALLAVCVALLGLAAVSPDLHTRLCAQENPAEYPHEHGGTLGVVDGDGDAGLPHDAPEHVCAVTLFAGGCDQAPFFDFVVELRLTTLGVAQFTDLLLSRTLRGPERVCGPPAHV